MVMVMMPSTRAWAALGTNGENKLCGLHGWPTAYDNSRRKEKRDFFFNSVAQRSRPKIVTKISWGA